MADLTPEERAALRKLHEAATPGPWEQLSGKYMAVDRGERPQVFRSLREADEALILAMRNALPTLLDGIEERDRLRELLRETRDMLWRIANGRIETARADAADEWNRLDDALRPYEEKHDG